MGSGKNGDMSGGIMKGLYYKIDTYQYQLFSSATSGTRGRILLYSNDEVIGIINLVDIAVDLPHSYRKPTGQYVMFYKITDMPYLIDMLRNESPIYLLVSGNGEEVSISTTQEPVGEGELPVLPPPSFFPPPTKIEPYELPTRK